MIWCKETIQDSNFRSYIWMKKIRNSILNGFYTYSLCTIHVFQKKAKIYIYHHNLQFHSHLWKQRCTDYEIIVHFLCSLNYYICDIHFLVEKYWYLFLYLYTFKSTIFTLISSSRHTEFAVAFTYYVSINHSQQLKHQCHFICSKLLWFLINEHAH